MIKKTFQKERKHKINSEVRFPQVRLVGMGEPKILSSFEASKIAESEGKDLILINESQNPPIVRIEDYNKFIYEMEHGVRATNLGPKRRGSGVGEKCVSVAKFKV